MHYHAFGRTEGATFLPPTYRGNEAGWSSVADLNFPAQTHRLVRHMTSPAALSVVAVGLLYAHHVRNRRLRYVDDMIARCSEVVYGGDDPDVHRIEWAESGSSGDATATGDPPASALGQLGLMACADRDGVAVRTVPNLGMAVVVCDRSARVAAVLVDRHPRVPATTTSDDVMRARILGRAFGA
jgi:hypothetical protein